MLGADHYDDVDRYPYRASNGNISFLTERQVFVDQVLHKQDVYTRLEPKDYTPAMKVLFDDK